MNFQIYKSSSFKKIFLPSYLEISTGFILSITDVIFVSAVDLSFVNAFAVIVTFMVLSYITSRIAAHIGASKVILAQDDEAAQKQARINCLTLVIGIGTLYTLALLVFIPLILGYSGIDAQWLPQAIVFSRIIVINSLCMAIRRGCNALFSVHKEAKINFFTTIASILMNLLLNSLAYFYVLPHSASYYAYAIALATIVSQLVVIFLLLYTLWKKERLPRLSKNLLNRASLTSIIRMAKTSFIASIESALFIATTYVFLTTMAHADRSLLTARNFLAPWFLLVGSIGQAWTAYVNREITLVSRNMMQENQHTSHGNPLWRPVTAIMAHSLLLTVGAALLLALIMLSIHPFFSIKAIPVKAMVASLLCLAGIDVFRSVNVLSLEVFRLSNTVKFATYNAVITQISIMLAFITLRPTLSPSFSTGVFFFALLIAEEATRTFINLRHLKKTPLVIR